MKQRAAGLRGAANAGRFIMRFIFAAALVATVTTSAVAQQQTVRLRGTIEQVDGQTLTLKAADGTALKLTLTSNARIVAVVKASLDEIKPGVFLGSAAMPQPD